jgi:hypothetical protein
MRRGPEWERLLAEARRRQAADPPPPLSPELAERIRDLMPSRARRELLGAPTRRDRAQRPGPEPDQAA